MGIDNRIIYFDHAATTSPMAEVVSLFTNVSTNNFANSSSAHRLGIENARLLTKARSDILSSLGMNNHEVIFLSGATEANNLALKGYMERYKARGNHLIVSNIEHPSILNVARKLSEQGFDVSYVKAHEDGKVYLDDIKKEIRKDTILVSIMAVNNETGIIQNIDEIAKYIKTLPTVALHVDAVQGVGKAKFQFNDIDLLTVSIHKLGGLKGTGLLIKRKNIELVSQIDGGGQENGLRSGTTDLANAVCDAFVIKKTIQDYSKNKQYIEELVSPLYDYFQNKKNDIVINSTKDNLYIINISLLHKKASVLAEFLSNNNIMVSTHSACSSKLDIGSPTLLAMGKNEVVSKNSIRLSFSHLNTKEEIDTFIEVFDRALKEIRG